MPKQGLSRIVFVVLAFVYLACFVVLNPGDGRGTSGSAILHSDGVGHYDYLPRLLLHHGLQYGPGDRLFASAGADGQYVNRFFCGTAVLELPFFLLGAAAAQISGAALDGYSPPFQYAIGLAAVFYALWGLWLLYRLLVQWMQVSPAVALCTVVLAALGTHLLYYTVWKGSFSHVFSFFAVTAFLYRSGCAFAQPGKKNLLYMGLLLGLVVIIRPVNVLVLLLVPLFFAGKTEFRSCVRHTFSPVLLLCFAAGALAPVLLQLLAWYAQTGSWFSWTYRQEGFYFLSPHVYDVLLGARRGLLVYNPLWWLVLPGLVTLYRVNRWKTFWLGLFLLVFTWVTASWWHWTYGDTFGIRPYNDVLSAGMIAVAFWLGHAGRIRKKRLALALLPALLSLVFTWQFARGIIHLSTMNTDKFFALFLRTGEHYRGLYGGCNDLPPYAPNGWLDVHRYSNTFDSEPGGYLHVGHETFPVATEFVFPPALALHRHLWITVQYRQRLPVSTAMKNVLLVYHALDPLTGNTLAYRTERVKEYPEEKTGEWSTTQLRLWLPDGIYGNSLVKTYLWNTAAESFDIDDFTLCVQVPRW